MEETTVRNIPISEILTMPDGEIIPSLTGVIIEVYPIKSYQDVTDPLSEKSTMQNCIVKEGEEVVNVSFRNQPEMTAYKGKRVTVACYKGRNGLAGVTKSIWKDREGQERHSVKAYVAPTVNPFAEAAIAKKAAGRQAVANVDDYLAMLVHIRVQCERAAVAVSEELDPQHRLGDERIGWIAGGFFTQTIKKLGI